MQKKGEAVSIVKMVDNSTTTIYHDGNKTLEEERQLAEEKTGKQAKKVKETLKWDSIRQQYV